MKNENAHSIMNYNQINDFIYVGNNICCHKHFNEELLSKGIRAVISLEYENIDDTTGLSYYFWFSWVDATAPSQELLKIGTDVLNSLENQNIKTYVHCTNGQGRAPTLVAAYLIRKGYSVDEAVLFIKNKRQVINPIKAQLESLDLFRKQYKNLLSVNSQ
jgi:protein-tyrosine phosphatase